MFCWAWPSVLYRGVDREPFPPTPEEEDAMRSAGNASLVDLWERYTDLEYSQEFQRNLPVAIRTRIDFLRQGIDVELVYCQIEYIPSDLDAYPHGDEWSRSLTMSLDFRRSNHHLIEGPPIDSEFLGFDVAHPVPSFHSAIFQPGLHRTAPHLRHHLNADGLFSDLKTVKDFVLLANEMDYGIQPFCALGVWLCRPVAV